MASLSLQSALSIISSYSSNYKSATSAVTSKLASLSAAQQAYSQLVVDGAPQTEIDAQASLVAQLTNEVQVAKNYVKDINAAKVSAQNTVYLFNGVTPSDSTNTTNPFVGATGPTGPAGTPWNVTVDTTPTLNSNNPVTSGGVYDSLQSLSLGVASSTTVAVGTSSTTSDAGTTCLLRFEGPDGSTVVTDSSSYNNAFTAYQNAHITTGAPKFGTSCLDLTTYPAYVASNGNVSVGTIEFWFKIKAFNVSGNRLFDGPNVSLNVTSSDFKTTFGSRTATWTNSFVTNTWYHFAACKNTYWKAYVNGVQVYSNTLSTEMVGGVLYIGGTPGGVSSTNYTNGYIDELRVSSTGIYTSAFTPPVTRFPDPVTKTLYYPSQNNKGQLWTDGTDLYLCTTSGTPGVWKKVYLV